MVYLSQRDPRWGWRKIGNSESLIKDYGCTITCISMLADYFGCFQDPAWMAKNLRFIVDKVIWQSVTEKLCFDFTWRFYKFEEKRILDALKSPSAACLFEIKKRHWVVGVRKSAYAWSKWFLTIDPWTGEKKWYHQDDISGGATFRKR